jgi:hypothetical protein
MNAAQGHLYFFSENPNVNDTKKYEKVIFIL